MKGKFICFEGIEGSGKSTMLRHTEKYLNNKKIKYIVTREPGGTDVGKKYEVFFFQIKTKYVTTQSYYLCLLIEHNTFIQLFKKIY